MGLSKNLILLWKKKDKIFEGIRNAVFRKEDVEEIAEERLKICRSNKCGFHDPLGESEAAMMKGEESCASCGCKLSWKTRALSDACPEGFWEAVVSEVEEAGLKEGLGME